MKLLRWFPALGISIFLAQYSVFNQPPILYFVFPITCAVATLCTISIWISISMVVVGSIVYLFNRMRSNTVVDNPPIRLFYHLKSVGKRDNINIISLGIISVCGKTFYAEFTGYDKSLIDAAAGENIIKYLHIDHNVPSGEHVQIKGDYETIRTGLVSWLDQFDGHVKFYGYYIDDDWYAMSCLLTNYADEDFPDNVIAEPVDVGRICWFMDNRWSHANSLDCAAYIRASYETN